MRVFKGQNLDELGSNAALFENERVSDLVPVTFLGCIPTIARDRKC